MTQSMGIFQYDPNNKKFIAKIDGKQIGDIYFDKSDLKLHFSTGEAFELRKDNKIYLKKKYFSKITQDTSDNVEKFKSIILFQNFLKESAKIIDRKDFIPKIPERIFLCQCFIELLEENDFHLSQYSDTYVKLLKLNLKLAEEDYQTWDANDDLYYALRKWLHVCMDFNYTAIEDQGYNRESEINKAIFNNGKIKNHLLKSDDERFQTLLRKVARDWFMKSRYDMISAGKIFWHRNITKKKSNHNSLPGFWIS
ncbi:hypothetical protein GF312_20360, partial [Candidatus Poribacteria bacterium]|nr:hypothetical protein [Candidatus Poribacteria bacterium]